MSQPAFEIEREETATKGRYVIRLEGRESEMTYTRSGETTTIIGHTYVPSPLRGQGLAEALVARGVEDARSEGRKILPLCSYVSASFRRHPEWHDVLQA